MPYNWKGDALAKLLILILVLVLLVNSGIIIGFQMMTGFPYESSAQILDGYADYNVIDRSVTPELSAYLLAAPAKKNRLVLTERHFLANRHRVLLDEEIDRGFSASIKANLGRVTVRMDGSKIGNVSLRPTSLPIRISALSLRVPLSFVLWNLALLAVELLVGYLIHKIRQG